MDDPKKKVWFIGHTRRLWLPVSWEGGLWFGSIFALGALMAASKGEQLSFAKHWPHLLGIVGYFGAFYWFTRGHVDKRY